MSRLFALGLTVACLHCGGDRLRPLELPDPRLPAPSNNLPDEPPADEPADAPPSSEPAPCTCAATANDGCVNNGRCDEAGACIYDTVPNGTACATAGLAGECIDRYCVPFDTRVYGPSPRPTQPWCAEGGVGLPATQEIRPVGGASCTIFGAGQMSYGNCPLSDYPMVDFEETSLAQNNNLLIDLRWLKFAGVISMRVRLPDEPSRLTYNITDITFGGGLYGYKLSISDEPCDVGNVVSRFDSQHCEAPGLAMTAFIDTPSTWSNNHCTDLHSGHIYYLNISGDGPIDVGGDGVIDAGDRLFITIRFNKTG
ncbi:MAG: hypothetical protein ACAI38_15040 [Myxococcota bacterium]